MQVMANYNVMLQRFWRDFEAAGNDTPATAREVAAWAYAQGLWQPPHPYDPVAELAEDLAKAWREEYRTHKGQRYRAKHAVKVSSGGVQFAFWADMDTAPHSHMQRAFGQRRQQIADDCYHYKTDVDVYNDKHKNDRPAIQAVLDFTYDVEERQQLDRQEPGDQAA